MNVEVYRAIAGDEVDGDPCTHLLMHAYSVNLHAESVKTGDSSQANGLAIRDSLELLSSFPELLIASQGRPSPKPDRSVSHDGRRAPTRRRRILK
jgi:hypothetical protein